MTFFLALIAWSVSLLVITPSFVFLLETLASFLQPRKRQSAASALRIAVIVPAHNEGRHLGGTIKDALADLREGDRLIVVADNCTDDTADVAQELGAEVIIRNDLEKRGKGYALQFAIDHLRSDPPDCVAFFDADCRIKAGTTPMLAAAAIEENRPAQALNIMAPAANATPRTSVAAFAWIIINKIRMSGLDRLADVTRFTGTGMAAPWSIISEMNFATGAINEDLLLTFKATEAGAPPFFVADAEVNSFFPEEGDASVPQRARWEHGSIRLLTRSAAPALIGGIVNLDMRRVMLALDAMIPPLVMFAALLIGAFGVTAALWPFVGVLPFAVVLLSMALFGASIAIGWLAEGRSALPLSQISAIIPFVLEKFHIYGSQGRDSSKTWTRTKRQGEDE